MCKFEANHCGSRDHYGWITFPNFTTFWQCRRFRFFSKKSYTWIQQKIISCSSCVNLKQIGVVFVMLKIDLSELCHPDSVRKSFSFLKLDTNFFSNTFILLYWISAKYTIAKLIDLKQIDAAVMVVWLKLQHFRTLLFWFDSLAFVFQTHTDFFQEVILLYLILTRDSNVQLMCKFEANQCGFHIAIDLSNNVLWPYWKVCKIARSFSQWEYASRLFVVYLLFCILSNMVAALSESSMAENLPFGTLSFLQ